MRNRLVDVPQVRAVGVERRSLDHHREIAVHRQEQIQQLARLKQILLQQPLEKIFVLVSQRLQWTVVSGSSSETKPYVNFVFTRDSLKHNSI